MSEKYKSFSELIKKAKKIQEGKIVELAMKMSLNPTMAIFVLKNHYKETYSDKSEIQHSGDLGINIGIVKPENDEPEE